MSSGAPNFLVEIGTEELPPKSLLALAEAFRDGFEQACTQAAIDRLSEIRVFATPRRLALSATLAERQQDVQTQTLGPLVKAAYDADGKPTRAAQGFASRFGVPVSALEKVDTPKGDKIAFTEARPGQPTSALLKDMVEAALNQLPIARRMRWGSTRHEFVRPVHWIVLLFAGQTCKETILGITSGNLSRGHRFHSPDPIVIGSPERYEEDLRNALVIADFDWRRQLIRKGVEDAAAKAGGQAVIDPELLNEVTALNEWPVPLLGRFEKRFLSVPAEALVSSMKEHQKYFHVVNEEGRLLPVFVTVANIASAKPQRIVEGNERVIRPRLADAAFFYETDCQASLADRRPQLKAIVFQEQLGTLFDKTERLAALAALLAGPVGADAALARRAGELCKSDLVSAMVGEFADLQGVMGRYYATNDGEAAEVAEAMLEHYLPGYSGDRLPNSPVGTALALADRLDTLTGIFGIGQQPTGSRDPFALRRATLGILRILVEKQIDIDLRTYLHQGAALHSSLNNREEVVEQVLTYFMDRFKSWYEDQGVGAPVFYAVAAKHLSNPLDIHQRVTAVKLFSQLGEAPQLAAANKRVTNILAKASDKLMHRVDHGILKHGAEEDLAATLDSVSRQVAPLLAARNYRDALKTMATLQKPVDAYFDQVMVNVEDAQVRRNRLTLLASLRNLFLEVADISCLVPVK